ncbi:unnamed protein product [Brassica rapa subsp. narinosa]
MQCVCFADKHRQEVQFDILLLPPKEAYLALQFLHAFFCIILPMTIFVPKTELPAWVVCYIPATMSFLNILPAPNSFSFIVPYLLFENTMSVTKFNAMVSGLFQLGSAYE